MSGLVEKVKGVVRNRSKHRQNESIDSTRPRTSTDQLGATPEISHPRSSLQESRRGRDGDLQSQNGLEGTTRSFQAMSVNDRPATNAAAVAATAQSQALNAPPLPRDAVQNIETARAQTQTSDHDHNERAPHTHDESPNAATHHRQPSGSMGGAVKSKISPEIIPDRDSSIRRRPVSSGKTDPNVNGPRSPKHNHKRSTDVARNDPSPLIPHFTTRSAASPTSPTFPQTNGPNPLVGETQHGDLRLPSNFDLRSTERTLVQTSVAPAVTQEKVHIQRTEVITQAFHRDVHIDHHYTYIQPIPVVEVLPARHFELDPVTGLKTEIAAPAGFKLPAHLQPRKAEDYSHLRQTTRHYVVDNEHPNGKLESGPRRDVEGISQSSGQRY